MKNELTYTEMTPVRFFDVRNGKTHIGYVSLFDGEFTFSPSGGSLARLPLHIMQEVTLKIKELNEDC